MKNWDVRLVFVGVCLIVIGSIIAISGCTEERKTTGKDPVLDEKIKDATQLTTPLYCSNVYRIVDHEYGYIIYETNHGICAVPLTPKKDE